MSVVRRHGPSVAPCEHGPNWGDRFTVAVLILNWNGKRFLQSCLASVMRAACRHVDVVLVDNGSSDGSVEYAQQAFPRLKSIVFHENLGFSRAYNAAVSQVSARFVVFLNNDTVVADGWLPPLIDALIVERHVAITTSKVLFHRTRVLNAAGGQLKLWQGASEFGFGREEHFVSGAHDIQPFYASGSSMAMSRDLFLQMGGFDTALWMYAEDLDISWRARLAGYKIRCVPESVVEHFYSGTAGVFDPAKHRQNTTNYLAVMIRCLSAPNLLHSLPAFVLFAFAKGLGLSVAERNPAYSANVVLALRDTAQSLGRLRAKRRETQHLRVVSDHVLLRSEGFGLFDSPWALVRILRRGQQLKKHRLPPMHESES
jgi:GT2 family glycosyltransferase